MKLKFLLLLLTCTLSSTFGLAVSSDSTAPSGRLSYVLQDQQDIDAIRLKELNLQRRAMRPRSVQPLPASVGLRVLQSRELALFQEMNSALAGAATQSAAKNILINYRGIYDTMVLRAALTTNGGVSVRYELEKFNPAVAWSSPSKTFGRNPEVSVDERMRKLSKLISTRPTQNTNTMIENLSTDLQGKSGRRRTNALRDGQLAYDLNMAKHVLSGTNEGHVQDNFATFNNRINLNEVTATGHGERLDALLSKIFGDKPNEGHVKYWTERPFLVMQFSPKYL